MIGALFRVIAGFVLASLAAGLAFVLFAVPPTELASANAPGLASVADWALKAGTQAAIFSAPFALIAAAIGEWQRLRSPLFYGAAGLLIALAGFMAQHTSEIGGQQTVLNVYAVAAFLVSGIVAGFAYWLIAGRVAGDEDGEAELEAVPAAVAARSKASPVAANGPGAKPVDINVSSPRPTDAAVIDGEAVEVTAADTKSVAAQPADAKAAQIKSKPPAAKDSPNLAGTAVGAATAAVDETRPSVIDPERKA